MVDFRKKLPIKKCYLSSQIPDIIISKQLTWYYKMHVNYSAFSTSKGIRNTLCCNLDIAFLAVSSDEK